jgi:predicted signal transduction protein with EAL and GGDEF domain
MGLGAALGLDVTVEGGETARDLEVAREQGAALGQGYLLSRPLPPEELAAWWRTATRTATAAAPHPRRPAPTGAVGTRSAGTGRAST